MSKQTVEHTTVVQAYQPITLNEASERALMQGDLSKLSAEDRLSYYYALCESMGLNPLTKPFIFMHNKAGELVAYAGKGCSEQLRKIHRLSVRALSRETIDDMHLISLEGRMPDGRTEEAQAVVSLVGLKGEARAIAMMRCETKAKRRLTLGMCGLGLADAPDGGKRRETGDVDIITSEMQVSAQTRAIPMMTEGTASAAGEALFGDGGGAGLIRLPLESLATGADVTPVVDEHGRLRKELWRLTRQFDGDEKALRQLVARTCDVTRTDDLAIAQLKALIAKLEREGVNAFAPLEAQDANAESSPLVSVEEGRKRLASLYDRLVLGGIDQKNSVVCDLRVALTDEALTLGTIHMLLDESTELLTEIEQDGGKGSEA